MGRDIHGKNNPMFGKVPWNKGKPHLSGERNPMFGKHHTEEAKQKMKPTQFKPGHVPWMKGKHHTEKIKQKMKQTQFKKGNVPWMKGKHPSEITKQKLREKLRGKPNVHNQNEGNPLWKGDEVGYDALHEWIKNRKPKPALCEICNERPSKDLANISGEYKRDVNDFQWICRRCHMKSDGRLLNLKQNRGGLA